MPAVFPWAAGWHPARPGIPSPVRPRGSKPIGSGTPAAWTCGYEARHVRTVTADAARLTVLGSCLASDQELLPSLELATTGRWTKLASWPGTYVAIVHTASTTIVLGDLAGVLPVFFVTTDDGVLWANACTPLAAYTGGEPKLDLLMLDMVLDGLEPFAGQAPYEGVKSVPPGSLLRIGPDGHRIERWFAALPSVTFEDATAGYADALVLGVERRAKLSSPLCAELSGLDSTSLAALAARKHNVVGFTFTEDPASDDLGYGRRVAACFPRLRREVFPLGDDVLHYSDLDTSEELPVTDLPSGTLLVLAHQREVLRRVEEAGGTDLLTGAGGDHVLSGDPGSLVDRLRRGHVLSAVGGAHRLARENRTSTIDVTQALLRSSMTPYQAALPRVARTLRQGGLDPRTTEFWKSQLNWVQPTTAAGWLTPDGAAKAASHLERLAQRQSEYKGLSSMHRWQSVRRSGVSHRASQVFAASYGIELHTPWFDARVLQFCDALPEWLREPPGTFKPLARGLMKLVGPEVFELGRKDRLDVTRTNQLGIERNAEALRRAVERSKMIGSGLFDATAVQKGFEYMIAGIENAVASQHKLLAADLWLGQHDDLCCSDWWEKA